MTAKQYVNAITKNIKCSYSKKKEIKQQLLADCNEAIENGETMESVMKRMGKVFEVANEFNENLPESEIKKYKKEKRIIIITIIAVVLALLCFNIYRIIPKVSPIGTSGLYHQEEVEQQMQSIITIFNNEDYDTLKKISIPQLQGTISKETLEPVKSQISSDWGAFESFGVTYLTEVSQYGETFVLGQINASYENVSITYTITLNEELKIAGFYIK